MQVSCGEKDPVMSIQYIYIYIYTLYYAREYDNVLCMVVIVLVLLDPVV